MPVVNTITSFFKHKSHKRDLLLFSLSIIISAFFIYKSAYFRWLGYETIPHPITDEFNYVWQAMSLRKTGMPVAWSTFTKEYTNPNNHVKLGVIKENYAMYLEDEPITLSRFKQDSIPIVAVKELDYVKGIEQVFFTTPFFDHPPTGGLIYSLGIGPNTTKFEQVKAVEFRKPALYLAVITAILIFIFSFLVTSNSWISTLAVIIYSTVPTYLLATRASYLENAAAPIVLLHLILLLCALKAKTNSKLASILFFVSGIFGSMAFLTKESAIGFLIGSLLFVLTQKVSWKNIGFLLLGMAIPFIGYLSWGLWLQKDVFLAIFLGNSSRGDFGSLKFVSMLTSLRFANFPIDGWWLWGFVSMFLVALQRREDSKLNFLLIPVAVHFFLVLFLGSPNYAWYYLILIPFLSIFSAVIVWRLLTKPSMALVLSFFLIPFSSSLYWGYTVINTPININIWRGLFLVTFLMTLLRTKFNKSRYIKYLWILFMIVLLYKTFIWNQRSVQYIVANWENYSTLSLPSF